MELSMRVCGNRQRFLRVSILLFVIAGIGIPCIAQEKPESDSVDSDYSKELPRIAPLEPDAALKSFQVAPGFHIEQVAAEPLVVDPIAMCFDERGRLYVIEMRDYSEDDQLRLGRVQLLEDLDGDGRFDQSTIFAEDLSWPTAIACYDGGVFVGAAPDVLYLKDTDSDGHADVRTVVLTGFGRSNVQGLLNSFQWGLDQRIHGATSSSGGDVRVASAAADTEPLVLRGRDFAFNPRTCEIEATSGGAQHGMSFDVWGDKFVCSNSDHIQQVMFEDRYAARNPYAAPPSPRVSIAVDGPQADVFRISPVEPWRTLRTRLRVKGIVPGPVEGGGRAAGYFTSATGVTIYSGDAWPKEYQGWAIVGDVGGNLVHRKRLDQQGIHRSAHRVDEKSEFIASRDIWFRPVQFANAPDGTLYVMDMYREVIEHPLSLHPVIKKHLDLTSGRDRGRIYRIVADGKPTRRFQRLDQLSTSELVKLLDHANGWHRETAARLVYERNDPAVAGQLMELATTANLPEGRIRALYALDLLHALNPVVVLRALDDSHPQVRRHAIRLAEREQMTRDAAIRAKLPLMAEDADPVVRYQLAFSLGVYDGPVRDAALAKIALRDGDDSYMLFAVQSSVSESAGNVMAIVASDKSSRQSSAGQALISTLAAQVGRQQRSEDVTAVLRILSTNTDAQFAQQLLTALAPKADSELAAQLAVATAGKSQELLESLLSEAREIAVNSEADVEARVAATERLQLGRFENESERLALLLAPDQPAAVQQAAMRTLSTFGDDDVAQLIVTAWSTFSPQLRLRAGDLLLSRSAWTRSMLDAVEQGQIVPGDIAPGHWQWLSTHSDPQLRERAVQLGQSLRGNRQEILQQYQPALEMEGDVSRGQKVFQKICANCHQLQGQGFAIGPNLAAMRNRGSEAILSNVMVPNAEVNPQYVNYVVTTKDGRAFSGIIAEESAASITLERAEKARDTILRIDIDQMRSTGMSLMPEGVENDIDVQGMADLLTYLRSLE
jgi:putative membrane-bound dehydrogenase-like protein